MFYLLLILCWESEHIFLLCRIKTLSTAFGTSNLSLILKISTRWSSIIPSIPSRLVLEANWKQCLFRNFPCLHTIKICREYFRAWLAWRENRVVLSITVGTYRSSNLCVSTMSSCEKCWLNLLCTTRVRRSYTKGRSISLRKVRILKITFGLGVSQNWKR